MSFKIAIIGAGSLVFARTLFTDIMSVPEFSDIEVAFTDINPDNLEKVTHLCQRDLDSNNIPIKIQSTLDRRPQQTEGKPSAAPDILSTASASGACPLLKWMWTFR